MSILTPILVTLAVTGVAVALAVRDASGLRARAGAWSWSRASGLVPSGWHPRWSWPGTGHLSASRDAASWSRPWDASPAPRVVSVVARDVARDVAPDVAPATSLGGPAAALPPSPAVAPVVEADRVPVHVITGVPLTPREARYGYTVPVTEWAPPAGLDWPPITRCEREPFVRVGSGGQCRRCTLRRGHPGDCVPGGAS